MKLKEFLSENNVILKEYLDSSKPLYDSLGIVLEEMNINNDELNFPALPLPSLQCYPNVVHGGIVMTFLDIAAGILALANTSEYHSKQVFTKKFECFFKEKMLVGQVYIVSASIRNFVEDEMCVFASICKKVGSQNIIIAEGKGVFKMK